jgi:hypothetical protein
LLLGLEVIWRREVMGGHDGTLARTRFGVAPMARATGPLEMSDLLLFDASAVEPPQDLEGPAGAARRALPSTRVSGARKLGVYWEVYGAIPADSVEVALTATPVNLQVGIFGQLMRALWGSESPFTIRWTHPVQPPTDTVTPRFPGQIALDISGLTAGSYAIRIAVRAAGDSASASRNIVVLR